MIISLVFKVAIYWPYSKLQNKPFCEYIGHKESPKGTKNVDLKKNIFQIKVETAPELLRAAPSDQYAPKMACFEALNVTNIM